MIAQPCRSPSPSRALTRTSRTSRRGLVTRRGLGILLSYLSKIREFKPLTRVAVRRALGLGRTKAYKLAHAGRFPCPVIRAGQTWLVPAAGLLTVLGLHGQPAAR